jgi:hypothetical protein
MSDVSSAQSTTPAPPPPLPNDPASRTPDGTLKDQTSSTAPAPATQEPSSESPKPSDAAKPTVPDTYTFKPTEGREIDPKLIERATPIFKELGLDQANAEKLVNLYNGLMEEQVKNVNTMREGWREATAKDPDMGSKLDAVKADIGRMKDALFANDANLRREFEKAMDLTGAGDHPAIVKAWWRASEAFREGSHVGGTSPSAHGQKAPGTPARPSLAQAMYPTLPS